MQGPFLNATVPPAPAPWATACHGSEDAPAPLHTVALCEHLALCMRSGLRWPVAAMVLDAAQRFVSARLVTTTALCVAVLGTASWLIWF